MAQQTRLSTIATPTRLYGSFSGKTTAIVVGRLVATDVRIEGSFRSTPSIAASYAGTDVKIEPSYQGTSVGLE